MSLIQRLMNIRDGKLGEIEPVERVIILVQPVGDMLKFRIVVPEWIAYACSPVMTVDPGPAGWNGNPHGVYGDAVAEYLGCNKHDVYITVSHCTNVGV
jgi:hypothetical protein